MSKCISTKLLLVSLPSPGLTTDFTRPNFSRKLILVLTFHVRAQSGIEIPLDQAIPVALLVNELITNSAKYSYPNGSCEAWMLIGVGSRRRSASQAIDRPSDGGVNLGRLFTTGLGLGPGTGREPCRSARFL